MNPSLILRCMNPQCMIALAWLLSIAFPSSARGQDWPMWRYDAQRSASSPMELNPQLHLQWSRAFPLRKQAWDDPLNQDLMTYDRTLEPIVAQGMILFGFNDADKVVAYRTETGEEAWTFYCEGPVRLPPVVWKGLVLVCSDDGHLYCLQLNDGKLRWKVRGGPNAQQAIGNQRVISAWPARGGPVVRDGIVYFAASIWPFMGTFIYALDAETGSLVWLNDSTGAQYIKQPHSAPSFAGVAPQGSLVATRDHLLVPGGRSVPAVFDRHTGTFQYFELNAAGKGNGGSFVSANDHHFFVHTRDRGTRAFDLATGVKTAFAPNEAVLDTKSIYTCEKKENDGWFVRSYNLEHKQEWELAVDGSRDLIRCGSHLVAAGDDGIHFIALPMGDLPARVVASLPITAPIVRLVAADQRLFAVTENGILQGYGPSPGLTSKPSAPPKQWVDDTSALAVDLAHQNRIRRLLRRGATEGYAFWFGKANTPLIDALSQHSPFTELVIVDSDTQRVHIQRQKLDRAARLGKVSVHLADPGSLRAPPYVAHRIFVEDELAIELWKKRDVASMQKIFASVRPYGGVLQLLTPGRGEELAEWLRSAKLEQADIEVDDEGVSLFRRGPLPGASDWTHQYGNIANTIKSDDQRVKLPLGVLWFGGSSNLDVLPRHGHGPPEQVVGGKLFIEGMNSLSARDVYTGRVLWKREFENLGTFDVYFDSTYEDTPLDPKYNQVHIPGANGRGTNYVVTEDRIYLLEGSTCHVLDPNTGVTLLDIPMVRDPSGQDNEWGFIGVYQDVLIGGRGFAKYRERHKLTFDADKDLSASKAGFGSKSFDRAASAGLVGFDRHTGKVLWQIDPKFSFWHNGIVAGDGKIFCLDRNPSPVEEQLKRRGKEIPTDYRIVALDVRTGVPTWQVDKGIFGTWLGYSEKHHLLLQAGAAASDRLAAETGQGMAVYRGESGKVLWRNEKLKYSGPCILHNDLIITNTNAYSVSAGAFYLETGKQKLVTNPLTGLEQPWALTRAYGCNSIIASENMLTFRSGAAGFYDLQSESGTGNLGGFKSGCTSNLVVANGVLNAPDYTRTCSCSYQNQTSLALVHMPDIEVWSTAMMNVPAEETRYERIAINLGAPGDRRDAQGRLWMEFPVVGGDAPPIPIEVNPEAQVFQHHSSILGDHELSWMFASGFKDFRRMKVSTLIEKRFHPRRGIPCLAEEDALEHSDGKIEWDLKHLPLADESGSDWVALRFDQIPLHRHAKLDHVRLQFTSQEVNTDAAEMTITMEDAGNALRFQEGAATPSQRKKLTESVVWKSKSWPTAKESLAAQQSPELKHLLQQVIDRDDWKAGNSVVFYIRGKGKRIAMSSKGESFESPLLIIEGEYAKMREVAPEAYDVRLHFALPLDAKQGSQFTIGLVGASDNRKVSLEPPRPGIDATQTVEWSNVMLTDALEIQLDPQKGMPVLNGLELIRRAKP